MSLRVHYKFFFLLMLCILLASIVACTAGAKKSGASRQTPRYDFTALKKSSIKKIITATGSLTPVTQVDVRSQLNGVVEAVYVHYSDHVKKGQLLARINTDELKVTAQQNAAALKKAQANYDLQLLDYKNKSALAAKGYMPLNDVKTSKLTLEARAGDLAIARALNSNTRLQLESAVIKSPIDGIVLRRGVDPGESVSSNSNANATIIFSLATDLKEMEIKTSVDELDIAAIRTGDLANFSIVADPNKKYTGEVGEIWLTPTVNNNVVTYTVLVKAHNTEGKFFPGMTADVEFVEAEKDDILVVPNAALRYVPSTMSKEEAQRTVYLAGFAPEERAKAAQEYDAQIKSAAGAPLGVSVSSLLGGAPNAAARAQPRATPGATKGKANGKAGKGKAARNGDKVNKGDSGEDEDYTVRALWYLDADAKLQVTPVLAGISDGKMTEIVLPKNSQLDPASEKIIVKEIVQ